MKQIQFTTRVYFNVLLDLMTKIERKNDLSVLGQRQKQPFKSCRITNSTTLVSD